MKQQHTLFLLALPLLCQFSLAYAGKNGKLHKSSFHCNKSINAYTEAICEMFLINKRYHRDIEYGVLEVPTDEVLNLRMISQPEELKRQRLNFVIYYQQPTPDEPDLFYTEGPSYYTTKNCVTKVYQTPETQLQYSHYYLVFYLQTPPKSQQAYKNIMFQQAVGVTAAKVVFKGHVCSMPDMDPIPIFIECHHKDPESDKGESNFTAQRKEVRSNEAGAIELPDWNPVEAPENPDWNPAAVYKQSLF